MKKFLKAIKFCKTMSYGVFYHISIFLLSLKVIPLLISGSAHQFSSMPVGEDAVLIITVIVESFVCMLSCFILVNTFAVIILEFLELFVPWVPKLIVRIKGFKRVDVKN